LIAAYAARFPRARTACETAEATTFFGETFDAIVAVGLMFLLSERAQRQVIRRVASALGDDGRFLFTAPAGVYPPWTDILTGRESRSLGKAEYAAALTVVGLRLVDEFADEGENHYFDAVKT
jgi:cyclopropane fatty-acyl-phospholipid synthase-like methyltransferase